jgi:hypothetical protein
MHMSAPEEAWTDPTWARLEEQITWYERRTRQARRSYRRMKITEILLAASLPLLAGFQDDLQPLLPPELDVLPAIAFALIGIAIVVLECILQLNQHERQWIAYQSSCDTLKHEKFLFLADAGPYANVEDKRARLAERIEELVTQAGWETLRHRPRRAKGD